MRMAGRSTPNEAISGMSVQPEETKKGLTRTPRRGKLGTVALGRWVAMSDRRISLRLHVGGLLLAAAVTSHAVGGNILFVDDDAPLGGDGLTWDTAYRFLQDALTDASGGGISEVHVAQGVYKPDRDEANPDGTGDRETTFQLINGVALMGGYAGIGAKDPDARDVPLYEAVLSGDLWNNDLPTTDISHPSFLDNIFHVLTANDVDSSAILDGFGVTGGVVGFDAKPLRRGGGMMCIGGSPMVRDCSFVGNLAASDGGSMSFWFDAHPTIEGCTISGSSASRGGGIHVVSESTILLVDSSFDGNVAASGGGGLYISGGTLTATNCIFTNNSISSNDGGAIRTSGTVVSLSDCYFGGNNAPSGAGLYCGNVGVVSVTHCDFDGNTGGSGAGIYIDLFEPGVAIIDRCTFLNNVSVSGSGVFLDRGLTTLIDCDFLGNTASNRGAGMYIDRPATLRMCRFAQNHADSEGGALYISADAVFADCLFEGNSAGETGGAIRLLGNNQDFFNCIFRSNSAVMWGGAVRGRTNAQPTFVCCIFSGNSAELGGATYFNDSQPTFANCSCVGNSAEQFGGGIYSTLETTTRLVNSVIWDNNDANGSTESSQITNTDNSVVIVDYCCVQGLTGDLGGDGNIGDAPLFVDGKGPDDIYGTEDDDVRLQSGSPCIDAAHNWGVPVDELDYDEDGITNELFPVDLDGNPRFNADESDFDPGCGVPVVVDMGAYEYQFDPVEDVIFADLNGDGSVGVVDLLGLLGGWGPCAKGCCLADLDLDGVVGVNDLLILLGHWG